MSDRPSTRSRITELKKINPEPEKLIRKTLPRQLTFSMDGRKASSSVEDEFITGVGIMDREARAEASSCLSGEQQQCDPEEDISPIASPPQKKYEQPSIPDFESMLDSWLEQKGNAERLMEKLGLRKDILQINQKMDEIVEGMEVCGRREVCRVVNDTVERAIGNALESQQVEYIATRAINQLTQDEDYISNIGQALISNKAVLGSLGRIIDRKSSEAVERLLGGNSAIVELATNIAQDVARQTLGESLVELNERADARICAQFELERDILWRDLTAKVRAQCQETLRDIHKNPNTATKQEDAYNAFATPDHSEEGSDNGTVREDPTPRATASTALIAKQSDSSDSGEEKRSSRKKGGRRSSRKCEVSTSSSSSSNFSSRSDSSILLSRRTDTTRRHRGNMGGLSRKDVIRPSLKDYRNALDFRNYRLANISQHYRSSHAKKIPGWKKRMQPEMEPHLFKGGDSIRILDYLDSFRRVCDIMEVHEGAALLLLPQFMTGAPKQDMLQKVETYSKGHRQSGRLTSYCQAVNYLLETYADNQTISRAHAEIIRLQQKEDQSPLRFRDHLFARASRCGKVYDQEALIHIFIEGCHESIRNLVRQKHADARRITLTKLAEYARDVDNKTSEPKTASEGNNERQNRSRRNRVGRDGSQSTRTESSYQTTPLYSVDQSRTGSPTDNGNGNGPTAIQRPNRTQGPQRPWKPRVTFGDARTSNGNSPNTQQWNNLAASKGLIPTQERQTQPYDPATSTAGMDSGLTCRICSAPATHHATSNCPHVTTNRDQFIAIRNSNYRESVRQGLIPTRYRPVNSIAEHSAQEQEEPMQDGAETDQPDQEN